MFYSIDTSKNIKPKNCILLLLSLFGIWQMGIMFFSGTSLSLYGKTPISFDETYTVAVIAAGYIVTIVMNYLLFEHSLLIGKIALFVSLLTSILMFCPFSTTVLTVLFYLDAFCCTFLIGTNYAIETGLFDNKSELKFVFVNSLIVFTAIAFLQGDIIVIPFWVFNIISVMIILALLTTYFLLPKRIESYSLTLKIAETEAKPIRIPFVLKAGTYLIVFASTLCLVFGSAISETVKYGTGLFYVVGIVTTVIFGFLVFKKNLSPYRLYTFSFVLIIVGFVFAALSTQFSWCIYPSIGLLGAACLPANTVGFLSNSLYKLRPSKAYAAIFLAIGLLIAGLQSVLLEMLQDNLIVLFSVLSVVAVTVLVLYVLIEANFTYAWKKATPNDCGEAQSETDSNLTFTSVNAEEKEQTNSISAQGNDCATSDILTERELQIVEYILQGYGNEEIGKALFLSPHTVKTHRKNIYLKLEIHSRRELFEWAQHKRQV